MLQVLVAGLIALGTKWLLEGGIRRRDRHVIREELELADLLGDRPEAELLKASAERRLARYLRPPLRKRAAPAIRSAGILVVAIIAGEVVTLTSTSGQTDWQRVLLGIGVGAAVAALAQGVQEYQRSRKANAEMVTRVDELMARAEMLRRRSEALRREAGNA